MKYLLIILCTISIHSCNSTYPPRKACEGYVDISLDSLDCTNIPLRITTRYLLSDADEYFIWSHYGIKIERDIDLDQKDSCMNVLILKKMNLYKPEWANTIQEKVDSISSIPNDPGVMYFDSAYSSLINSRAIGGTGAYPRYNSYKQILTFLEQKLAKAEIGYFEMWLKIDEFGDVVSVEPITLWCNSTLEKLITSTIDTITWEPGKIHGKDVDYRLKLQLIGNSAKI